MPVRYDTAHPFVFVYISAEIPAEDGRCYQALDAATYQG
jgi:hypothetical protein